jgi:hypothetical protein
MSKLEQLSNKFLRVGRHPFKMCIRSKHEQEEGKVDDEIDDTTIRHTGCCHSNSPLYAKFWPIIFLFSAITDFPMPLPKGKRPGQHRDWGWLPIMIVVGFVAFIYYGYLDRIICKYLSTHIFILLSLNFFYSCPIMEIRSSGASYCLSCLFQHFHILFYNFICENRINNTRSSKGTLLLIYQLKVDINIFT